MKAIEQYFHVALFVFLTILQNEIQDFLFSFKLSTLGSERVNEWPMTTIKLTTKRTNENSKQIHVSSAMRGKTRATKSRLVLG